VLNLRSKCQVSKKLKKFISIEIINFNN
jgi:hypothetical protein